MLLQRDMITSRKRKVQPVDPQAQQSPSKAYDPLVNVLDDTHSKPSEFGDVFRRKKLKLTPSHGEMQTKENVGVSRKTPAVVRVIADSPARTPTHDPDTISVSVSSHDGDRHPSGAKMDPDVTTCPKVSRASRLHVF